MPFDFGVKRPTLIDHLQRVKEKSKLLEAISDICVTEKCLLNVVDDISNQNMALRLEKEMLTKITYVPKDDCVFEFI